MKAALIVVLVLAVVGLGTGTKFVSVRRNLIEQRQAVDAGWSEVEGALQRRADLIPHLVETAQTIATGETKVYQDIADARAAMVNARSPLEKIQANDQLSTAMGRLLVTLENYPKTRSNPQLVRLQDEIAGTENRIAIARRTYNENLEHYNAQIQMFPDNVVAGVSGFARNDAYFKTEPGAR